MTSFTRYLFGQVDAPSKRFTKDLKEHNKRIREVFPPLLSKSIPTESLAGKFQSIFRRQANAVCGIKRVNDHERLYIPQVILKNYPLEDLTNRNIYSIPISSENFLFWALTPSDISKLESFKLSKDEGWSVEKIIGLNDEYFQFTGSSILQPASGFPSFVYQNSCGSYFEGNLEGQLNAPFAELKTSLESEANLSSLITTVTGRFESPLKRLLSQNSRLSTYLHLLVWEMYAEQSLNKELQNNELLLHNGKYVSEIQATLTNVALDQQKGINMRGRIATKVAFGIIKANGEISAGIEANQTFSLKDFDVSIHKNEGGDLIYNTTKLPSLEEINMKLQNSFSIAVNSQPVFEDIASPLYPVKLSTTMGGIPSTLCGPNSWIIEDTSYDASIWKTKPVISSLSIEREGLSECICNVEGDLNPEAVNTVIENGEGRISNMEIKLTNVKDVRGHKIEAIFHIPSILVSDGPKIAGTDDASINNDRFEFSTAGATSTSYKFPIKLPINDNGLDLSKPYDVEDYSIEFIYPEQKILFAGNPLSLSESDDKSIEFSVSTQAKPKTYVLDNYLIVPIRIVFRIRTDFGSLSTLSTEKIELQVPNLVPKKEEVITLETSDLSYEQSVED